MKNKQYPPGWWITPMVLLAGLCPCVLLIALLLPYSNTGNGAFWIIVVSFSAALIGGLISLWVMR